MLIYGTQISLVRFEKWCQLRSLDHIRYLTCFLFIYFFLYVLWQISQRHALIRNISQQWWRQRWHLTQPADTTATATPEPAQLCHCPHAPAQFVHESVEQHPTGCRGQQSTAAAAAQLSWQRSEQCNWRWQHSWQQLSCSNKCSNCRSRSSSSGSNNNCKCHGFLHAQLFGYYAMPGGQIQQRPSQWVSRTKNEEGGVVWNRVATKPNKQLNWFRFRFDWCLPSSHKTIICTLKLHAIYKQIWYQSRVLIFQHYSL